MQSIALALVDLYEQASYEGSLDRSGLRASLHRSRRLKPYDMNQPTYSPALYDHIRSACKIHHFSCYRINKVKRLEHSRLVVNQSFDYSSGLLAKDPKKVVAKAYY